MYKQFYVSLALLSCIYLTNAQNRTLPDFPTPQNDFYRSLEEEKVTNPLFLEGNVREVNRTFTQHISPDSDQTYTENYYYLINTDRKITKYTTDNVFDDITVENLNSELLPIIVNDTIIKEDDFYTYIYKKGKLTNYMAYDIEGGMMDSIVYNYKNNQLHTRTHYRSEGAIAFNEEDEIDESVIYFSEFTIYGYGEATYTKTGQLQTLLQHEFTVESDLIDTYKSTYTYDPKGRFNSVSIVSDRYFLTYKQLDKHPKKWKLQENETVEGMYLETNITVTYDNQNRIETYSKVDSQKNNIIYEISYDTDRSKKIKVARDDYHFQKEAIIHRDLLFEYTYDSQHNPTYIASYILLNDKKIIDKSTKLAIVYY
ncbi:hypothetical protein [uncultured Dokdonia sp.]|uniref:hypothetical protein n=1 Tax=uncultured Dokdonia sp. TaxID=575653 RepID=UPI0026117900|nr:hypothetical protein [uncultured Dokdonia sp.]